MAFKLVVSNTVEVPVKFTVNDGGKTASFQFAVLANRLPADAFKALADDRSERTVAEFLAEQITGWRGQRLVVDDNGQPVEFSPDALAVMLSLVGLAGLVFEAYVLACGAQGKAKN
jgi:hypothetical protein